MTRVSKFDRRNYRPHHHNVMFIVTSAIIIIIVFFAGCFFFNNNNGALDHRQAETRIVRHRPSSKEPQPHPSSPNPKPKIPKGLNTVKAEETLNRSNLSPNQKGELIKMYQKLSPNQQKHVLNTVNDSKSGLKIGQDKFQLIKQYLKM